MDENKIIGIVTKSGKNDQWTVVQMLEDALQDEQQNVGEGADKAVLIHLNTRDGGYELGYSLVNMSCDEVIAMLEVMKSVMLERMGY